MRSSAVVDIDFPPRLRLSRIPTPIEMLQWLPPSIESAGVEVFIKRDDLTGCGLSGNKVRKLDYLLADAMAQGCDTLLTCGDVNSNHCRATALSAARFGCGTYLLLRGQPSEVPDGNHFLDLLVGAEIEYITPDQYASRDALLAERADRLKAQGKRPYVIPEGGSNPLGIFGYANCAREIAYQSEGLGYQFSHVVCATSSAGTQAGLIVGCQAYLPEVQVVGVSAAGSSDVLRNRVSTLLELWVREYSPGTTINYDDIHVVDDYVGPGYAQNVPEDLEMIRSMARTQGLLLDPVYTVKAFRGMCEEIRKGRFPRGSSVLFIHTGGMLGLFPRRADLLGELSIPVLQEAP